ncbi:MAG: hypothetical protein NZ765_10765, partial [Anaerolineae bacterium]|nr:hypothetical protein [Anaerolineae bacterium]
HLIHPPDLPDTARAMDRAIAAFGTKIILAHANDVCFSEGRTRSCPAGTGQLNYGAFVEALRSLGRQLALCIEHVTEEQLPATIDYVKRFL